MKKILKLLLLTCLSLPIISCNKSIEKGDWEATITKNKMNSLPELFSQAGSEKLITIVTSNNELKTSNFNKLKANQVASYFKDKYKIDITEKFIDNPEGIVILGMLYASKEYEEQKALNQDNGKVAFNTDDDNMNCFLTAVSDVIGVSQAKTLWKSILAGAAEETVIAAVSLIGRRVVGILTITTMVYSTGDCLGWW